jgi:hypothetical protein
MPKNNRLPGDIRARPEDLEWEEQPLTDQQRALVNRAYQLFEFYREKLLDDHEEMHASRLTRQMAHARSNPLAPASYTLNSCIDNVIADQLDNMPEAKLLPEREETAYVAEEISDLVAYILYHANWPETYASIMEDAAVTGTGIAQIYWDDDMEDGDGMVNVMPVHPEDFYPDPAYENIQDGRGIFLASRVTVAWVMDHFPEDGKYVRPDKSTLVDDYSDPVYEAPGGDDSTILLEFWYKTYDAKKRKNRVHKALMAGRALLFSTELEYGGPKKGEYAQGVYAHGLYPFVLFKYRSVFRRPFGTGMIHDYQSQQDAIDRYLKYIDDNARVSSKPKTYIRRSAGINPEDVSDYSKDYVEFDGNDIREILQTVQADPLNGQVYQIMNYLIDSMKQDCGQNQFSRGEGGLGVTAASAIQALQEAGGKITRMHTEHFKQAFKLMVEQVMWDVSEYLSPERKIRIVGGWDSTGNMVDRVIQLVAPGFEGDELKKPAYSVQVQVQKRNPLQLQVDNEFLNQCAQICAQAGQPLPPEAVIGLMEGYRTKSSVLKVVKENSIVQQQIQQMQAQVENLTAQLEQQKRANQGYMRAMTSQGGGQIARRSQQEQASAPAPGNVDYSGLLSSQQQGNKPLA